MITITPTTYGYYRKGNIMWDLTMYPISEENLNIILDLIDEYVELREAISEMK
jgi:hypothetical protein